LYAHLACPEKMYYMLLSFEKVLYFTCKDFLSLSCVHCWKNAMYAV